MPDVSAALSRATNYVRDNLDDLAGRGTAALFPRDAFAWAAARAVRENSAPEVQALLAAIASDGVLSAIAGKNLTHMGGLDRTLEADSVATSLIVAELMGHAGEVSLPRLQRVVSENSATGFLVQRLDGVTVSERIQVAPSVEVMPEADAPPARQQFLMTGFRSGNQPTAAIVKRLSISPLFRPPAMPLDFSAVAHAHEELAEVAHAIGVATAGNATPLNTAGTFHDVVLDTLAPGGHSYPTKAPSWWSAASEPLTEEALRDALRAIQKFKQRKHGSRSAAIIAERLVGSRRGPHLADRALELGIALEGVLTFGDDDTTEVSFRVRLRAAWLLGADGEARSIIFDWVKAIYGLRSKVAHGKSLPDQVNIAGRAVPVGVVIDLGSRLCSAAALSLFVLDAETGWKQIVLNGPPVRRDCSALVNQLREAGDPR